jgi:hypothetical protein
VVALAVGIPFVGYVLLLIVGAFIDNITTTTNQTVVTQTTLSGTTPTDAPATTLVPPLADITAQRMTSPPSINAEGSDWPDLGAIASEFQVYLVGTNNGLPTGDWWVGWDEQNLYVYVAVVDPVLEQYWVDEPFRLWNGDSVNFEFGRDPTGISSSTGLRPSDVHVLIGPMDEGRKPAIAAINRVENREFVPGPPVDIEAMAFSTLGSGYQIEARIPWVELGVSNPVAGAVFAMNVNISDVGSDITADGLPDLRSMVSNNEDRVRQTFPGTWTTLVLGP